MALAEALPTRVFVGLSLTVWSVRGLVRVKPCCRGAYASRASEQLVVQRLSYGGDERTGSPDKAVLALSPARSQGFPLPTHSRTFDERTGPSGKAI